MAKPNKENEHLLEHNWNLWFRPPGNHSSAPQAKAWENSQKLCFEAETVEDFWRGFHKLPRILPNHPVNCDYSLFRRGILPAWEDQFNSNGGRWTYNLERRPPHMIEMPLHSIIETVWLDLMLSLVGEAFQPVGEEIAGGVCALRKPRGDRPGDTMSAKIHVWTKDFSNVEANQKIGEILKQVLQTSDGQLIYTPHETNDRKVNRSNYGPAYLKV